jgi:hypothetical protein
MFDRFRKTNAPAREEEGRVAVMERERAATAEPATTAAPATTAEPATTAAPATSAERASTAEPATTAAPATTAEPATTAATTTEPDARTTVAEPEGRPTVPDRGFDDIRERRTLAPVVGDETLVAMHDRQRVRFGGIRWGSAFFGLLSAIGLAAMLLGIVAAAGVAIGLSEIKNVTKGNAETIGLAGAILVLAILALSWFCGGYVAGRMARFDGMRQGIGVWAWTVLVGVVVAIAAVIGGSEYDVFARLNLPNVAVGDQTLTTGGAITLAAALVVTLVAAIAGGKFGDRYHRRVDRFAAREYVEEP